MMFRLTLGFLVMRAVQLLCPGLVESKKVNRYFT